MQHIFSLMAPPDFRYRVRFGNETNRLYRNVAYTKIHQDFEYEEDAKVNSDIALLTLDEPVTFTKIIYPICMPPRNKNYDETKATVAGNNILYIDILKECVSTSERYK